MSATDIYEISRDATHGGGAAVGSATGKAGFHGVAVVQAATIADFTPTTDLTGVDTGTDMTAAQAAQIEADFAAIQTKLNAVLAALEGKGILASA